MQYLRAEKEEFGVVLQLEKVVIPKSSAFVEHMIVHHAGPELEIDHIFASNSYGMLERTEPKDVVAFCVA